MFADWFDERFVAAGARSFLFSPVRLLMGVLLWVLIGLGVDWTVAGVWTAAVLALEVPFRAVTRPMARGEPLTRRDAWACFATYAITISAWSVGGGILWASPNPACQLAGAAFFAGHLLYLETHHGTSVGALIPAVPALLLPLAAPLMVQHYHGVDQVLVAVTLTAVVAHASISIWESFREAKTLMAAKAALVKARDEAETASRAKSAFLATMSHEIRTPLNGVLGMAQAISAQKRLPKHVRAQVEVIRESGEGLLAILNDILDLSRVEAGKLELESIGFDLAAVAQGARRTFSRLAEEKGVAVGLELGEGVAGIWRGDPTRVRQILHNLISNALKFTEAGRITIALTRTLEGLRLSVSDTGVGIEAEALARLFSKFEQADASTTRRYGGAGLGLSICRELAQLMGGTIAAESTPGEGSTFTATLPLARLGDAPEAASAQAQAPQAPVRPMRVLAAEDNAVNQLVLKTLLAQVGVEPMIVADGKSAVDAWAREPWDLILMDVQMPIMDGPTAARAIRAAEARDDRARTPIVALTANAMAHQVAEYLDAGMDSHVAKPIEAAALYAELQRVDWAGEGGTADVAAA